MDKKLSILICSLESRKKFLNELLHVLEQQIDNSTTKNFDPKMKTS